MTTITISFRAKLDDFAGGKGYKIPTLTTSHVTADRDTYGILFVGGLGNTDVTRARLAKLTGAHWPGVVWADAPGPWTVTPRGNGFMADVTRTLHRTP